MRDTSIHNGCVGLKGRARFRRNARVLICMLLAALLCMSAWQPAFAKVGDAGEKAVAVLEKDVSFGAEGTVHTNVASALQRAGLAVPLRGFVGGWGGDDITAEQVRGIFARLQEGAEGPAVTFLGIDEAAPSPLGPSAHEESEVQQ